MEERLSELERIAVETSKSEKQRAQKLKQTGQTIQELWDNYKRYDVLGWPKSSFGFE